MLGGNLVLQWQDGGQQPGSTPASLDLALDKYTRAAEGVSAGYSDLAGLVGALAAAGLGESAAQSASGQEAPAPGAQHGAAGRRDDDPTRGPRGGRGEAEPAYVRDAGGLRDPGYAVGDRDRYPPGLAPARGGAMPGEQGCERGGGGERSRGNMGAGGQGVLPVSSDFHVGTGFPCVMWPAAGSNPHTPGLCSLTSPTHPHRPHRAVAADGGPAAQGRGHARGTWRPPVRRQAGAGPGAWGTQATPRGEVGPHRPARPARLPPRRQPATGAPGEGGHPPRHHAARPWARRDRGRFRVHVMVGDGRQRCGGPPPFPPDADPCLPIAMMMPLVTLLV